MDNEYQITPEIFALLMERIARRYADDPETAHGKADELMMLLLRQLGYDNGVEVFKNMRRWYS